MYTLAEYIFALANSPFPLVPVPLRLLPIAIGVLSSGATIVPDTDLLASNFPLIYKHILEPLNVPVIRVGLPNVSSVSEFIIV